MILLSIVAVMFVLSVALSSRTPSLTKERDPQYWAVCPIIRERL